MHTDQGRTSKLMTKKAARMLKEINDLLKKQPTDFSKKNQTQSELIEHVHTIPSSENHGEFVNNSSFFIQDTMNLRPTTEIFLSNVEGTDEEIATKQIIITTIKKKVHLRDITNKERAAVELKAELKIEKKLKIASSVGGHLILIFFEDEILEIDQFVKLLHFYARFVMTRKVEFIAFKAFSIPPPRLQTDKEIVKVFIDFAKNSKKNRLYKNSKKHKMIAEKSIYLRINDKKEKKTAKKSPSYDFIDSYDANIKIENVWFFEEYTEKAERNKAVLQTIDEHRKKKDRAWKKYLEDAYLFWTDKMIWEWRLMHEV